MVSLGGGESGSPVDVAQGRCQELRGALVPHHQEPPKGVQLRLPPEQPGAGKSPTFIRFYAYYYNHVRPHQSLNQNTPIPSWKATRIQRLQKALEVTKSLS